MVDCKSIIHNNHLYEVSDYTLTKTNLADPNSVQTYDYPFILHAISFVNGYIEVYSATIKFIILLEG